MAASGAPGCGPGLSTCQLASAPRSAVASKGRPLFGDTSSDLSQGGPGPGAGRNMANSGVMWGFMTLRGLAPGI